MVDDPSPDDVALDEDELHTTMESEVDAVLPDFERATSPRVDLGAGAADVSAEDDAEPTEVHRPSRPPLSAPPRPASKRSPSSTVPRPRGKPNPTPLGLRVPSSTRPLSDPPRPVSSRPPSKKPRSKAAGSNPTKTPASKPPPAPDDGATKSPKSVPPTVDESAWLAPEGMFASGDYAFERTTTDPFASRGADEAPGLDAPTVKMSALRDLDLGAYDDPHDDDPVLEEEDAFDGAKTQKLHRPDLEELRRVGADLGLLDDKQVADPKTDADGLPTPGSDAPEAPAADPGPDELDAPTMVVDPEEPPEDKPKKRKSRRGRKRTALIIPDDATPMPPPVALAEMTPDIPDEREREPSGEFVDADAIEEVVSDADAPAQPPPPRDRLQTLQGNGPSSPPPPPRRDHDDEVTLLRPSPALQKALEEAAAMRAEEEASPHGEPDPVVEASSEEPSDGAFASEPASDADTSASGSSPEMTPSAPGVMTDQASIGVVRPIQIVSDLPAVEELKQRTIEAAMGHNAPPFEIEASPDSAEEIDPEPYPPGPPPTTTPVPGEGSVRRPPPPRRGTDPSLEAIEEVEPDRMSLPAQRGLPPPRSGEPPPGAVMTQAEADLALAEARAREAEAKARQAAARAAEADAKAKAAKRPPKKPWWAEMFEGDLIRTLDNPRKLDVEKETSFIEQCLRLPKGSRVLDLACGNGVHAVELSSRGFQVVGVDYSDKMLDLARAYNNQRGTSVSFIQGDMRKLNLEGVFDGIYCWSSSFGYFDESTNANVLERIARAVRPGGTFALDMDNRDFVAPRAPQMAWFEKPGVVCMDEMRFDYYSSRMITRRMAIFEDQAPREIETTIRLYTLREIGRLLQKVGFKVLEVSGHRATRGAYFGDVSPRIIICCQRAEDD